MQTRTLTQDQKMERILFYLDSCREAVQTPAAIARGTQMTMHQVYRALRITWNKEHGSGFKGMRTIRAVGSQYQTYYYSAARCEPIELPF